MALLQGEIENGNDLELKAFARQTLPKIQGHLQRALKLAEHAKPGTAAEWVLAQRRPSPNFAPR
jgi:Domain of unknown function (DUF4142)